MLIEEVQPVVRALLIGREADGGRLDGGIFLFRGGDATIQMRSLGQVQAVLLRRMKHDE